MEEDPAPSEKMPSTRQSGSGLSFAPLVVLTFGTLPPTAVTHGLSSQVAGWRVAVLRHANPRPRLDWADRRCWPR